MSSIFYTIGHSNHSLDAFLHLLMQYGITAIADVRSHPYSRHVPHFNHDNLKRALQSRKIAYSFLGLHLGARSADAGCYDQNGQVLYSKLAQTDEFRVGIRRLIEGSKTYTIALMCSEKEPLDCHRTILVSAELSACDYEIRHIHPLRPLETQHAALIRLTRKFGLENDDLLTSEIDRINEACCLQSKKIAYKKPIREKVAATR